MALLVRGSGPVFSSFASRRGSRVRRACSAAWEGAGGHGEADDAIQRYKEKVVYRLEKMYESSGGYSPISHKDLAEVMYNKWRGSFVVELDVDGDGDMVAMVYGREVVGSTCYEGVVEVLNRYKLGPLFLRGITTHPSSKGPSRSVPGVPTKINLHAPEGDGRESEWC